MNRSSTVLVLVVECVRYGHERKQEGDYDVLGIPVPFSGFTIIDIVQTSKSVHTLAPDNTPIIPD